MSISDAHAINAFLFLGQSSACIASSDFTGDGHIDIADGISVLVSEFFADGITPCEPQDSVDETACVVEDGAAPASDPESSIELVDVSYDSAQSALVVVIEMTPSAESAGFSVHVAVDGDILADENDLTVDAPEAEIDFAGGVVRNERMVVGFLQSNTGDESLAAGEPVLVTATACVQDGVAAGVYAVSLENGEITRQGTGKAVLPALGDGQTVTVDSDCQDVEREVADPEPCSPPGPPRPPPAPLPPFDGPTLDFRRGDITLDGRDSISDGLMLRRWLFNGDRAPKCLDAGDVNDDGQINIVDFITLLVSLFLDGAPIPSPGLEISADPTEDQLGCGSETLTEPESTDDIVRLGEVTGAPGQTVEIPVFLTNEREVEAFQILISYDSTVFTPGDPKSPTSPDGLVFDGTFYEGLDAAYYMAVAPLPGVDDDIFAVSFIPSLIDTGFETPPGEDRLVFKIPGSIAPDVPAGTTIDLEPTNGPNGEGLGPARLLNELTYKGQATFFSGVPETIGARLRISPDVTIFIRGDANGDTRVDQSDAVSVLGFLYRGEEAPECLDAADANDDGRLDISDPIGILETVFRDRDRIRRPYPSAGMDPTGDAISCRGRVSVR